MTEINIAAINMIIVFLFFIILFRDVLRKTPGGDLSDKISNVKNFFEKILSF